jgi:predicted lysophospholipase L1 biosynthesis ABC-type transport system permease subunit
MSIFVSEAVTAGMRNWVAAAPTSPAFTALRADQARVDTEVTERIANLRHLIDQNPGKSADPAAFKQVTGSAPEDLRKELQGFPLSNDDMARAASVDPASVRTWLDAVKRQRDLREKLTAPQSLEAKMRASGVPATAAEIANDRIQKRWLVGLALLVAFVGILNAMLMSVTERFREIGTMKCLGALDSFIIKLFLIESLFQGITGTLIGVGVGLALSLAASAASYGSFAFVNLPMSDLVTYSAVCLVVGVGLTVGGAVYPAWQAARMQPIDAMRVDA